MSGVSVFPNDRITQEVREVADMLDANPTYDERAKQRLPQGEVVRQRAAAIGVTLTDEQVEAEVDAFEKAVYLELSQRLNGLTPEQVDELADQFDPLLLPDDPWTPIRAQAADSLSARVRRLGLNVTGEEMAAALEHCIECVHDELIGRGVMPDLSKS